MPSNLGDVRLALSAAWARTLDAVRAAAHRRNLMRSPPLEVVAAAEEGAPLKPAAEDRLLSGPVLGSLVSLATPIMGTYSLHAANQFIDAFWVGRLGAVGLAAVSVSIPIVFVLFTFGMGFGIAGSALVAQYTGARRRDMVDEVAGQTLLTILGLSVILTALGVAGAPLILTLMGVAPNVREGGLAFLHICFVSLPFNFIYFMFAGLMRGVGRPNIPLLITIGVVALNFVINPVLIFGAGPIPALGVAGSALATLIAQAGASILAMWLLWSGRFGICVRLRHLRPNLDVIKRTLLLGYPAAVEGASRGLAVALMTFLAAGFGTVATAAYGVGNTIQSIIVIPAMGFSMATATLIGQNIGARQLERAERVARMSVMLCFAGLMFCGLLSSLFAERLVRIFVPNDTSVVQEAGAYLRIISLSFGFLGVQNACIGVLRGAGLMSQTMLISVLALWIVQFPLCYVLAEHTPLATHGIYWGVFGANLCACLLAYGLYKGGEWKRTRLIETAPT